MKNIPVFTACGGTATLILREIPMFGRAYVILQTQTPGQEQLQAQACAEFCRQAGAREVYVTSRDCTPLTLEYSHAMYRRTLTRAALTPPTRPVTLMPLQDAQIPLYVERFNAAFAPVLNAAMVTANDIPKRLAEGNRCFFAYSDDGQAVGLGNVNGAELSAIASFAPGWGKAIAQALLAETTGDPITLLVCSANSRAMALYDRLGFSEPVVISEWYHV